MPRRVLTVSFQAGENLGASIIDGQATKVLAVELVEVGLGNSSANQVGVEGRVPDAIGPGVGDAGLFTDRGEGKVVVGPEAIGKFDLREGRGKERRGGRRRTRKAQ